MAPVMAFAFSTASSGATLPVTLETVKKRIGVRNEIASFVVPVGATINMDGLRLCRAWLLFLSPRRLTLILA